MFMKLNLDEKWTSLQPLDRIKLKSGNRIPKCLDASWATVIRRNCVGNVVIQVDQEINGFTRTITGTDAYLENEKESTDEHP